MHPDAYAHLAALYPTDIVLPTIDRPYRHARGSLADVREKSDLYSRLLFGDLVDDSFRKDSSDWSADYRDGFGNGLDLKISGGRFEARSFFLGSESFSAGPAANKEAFMQLIGLAGHQWARVLKQYLEARYAVNVADSIEGLPMALYIPDGWLHTLLIPIPVDRLSDVRRFHLALAENRTIGASQTGSIALQMQVINYVEGCAPEGCDDPVALIRRHLLSCNTPLLAKPVRETAGDGSAAWTLRRMAYLYRCTAFLRDVPRIMEKLHAAQLLPTAPDMYAAVVPSVLLAASEHCTWWSAGHECRSTWAGFENQANAIVAGEYATSAEGEALLGQAHAAALAHARFFSSSEGR